MLINFDDNRIVYAHAVNRDYDHRKLIFKVIKVTKTSLICLASPKEKHKKPPLMIKPPLDTSIRALPETFMRAIQTNRYAQW